MIKRLLVAFGLLIVLVGCGSASSSEKTMLTANTIIIDVRTPAEYAEGHVEGSINLDLESGHSKLNYPIWIQRSRTSCIAEVAAVLGLQWKS